MAYILSSRFWRTMSAMAKVLPATSEEGRKVASQLAPHFHCAATIRERREEGRLLGPSSSASSSSLGQTTMPERDQAQSLGFVKLILSTLYTRLIGNGIKIAKNITSTSLRQHDRRKYALMDPPIEYNDGGKYPNCRGKAGVLQTAGCKDWH